MPERTVIEPERLISLPATEINRVAAIREAAAIVGLLDELLVLIDRGMSPDQLSEWLRFRRAEESKRISSTRPWMLDSNDRK